MKRVLIINLRRFGDIFSSANLVNSYLAKDPTIKIEMVVYKEFAKAANAIKSLSKVHVIDRMLTSSVKANPIFSDGYAVDIFYKEISPLRNVLW